MISMNLDIAPDSRALLEQLARQYPDASRRAFFRAASIVARKMRSRMNPRSRAVEPWQDITKRIRSLATAQDAKTFGGKLMYPNGRQIAIKPLSFGIVVGWVDDLENAAIRFQTGGSAATSPSWRQYLYRRGIEYSAVPKVAETPSRPVVDPVAEDSAAKFPEWMLGAMRSILEKKIKRATINFNRSPATSEGARAASNAADAFSAWAMIQGGS